MEYRTNEPFALSIRAVIGHVYTMDNWEASAWALSEYVLSGPRLT